MSARILLVEDEPDFRRILETVLKKAGFTVLIAEDGLKGERMARASPPDLVVLDWNLPGQDGLAVCKALKSDPLLREIPIVMLTVRSREADAVLGLEIGADDYVSKRSLRPRELVARIHAALRKKGVEQGGRVLRSGILTVDAGARQARLGDSLLDLRKMEFDLLFFLLKNKGLVFTRSQITESVWGSEYFGTSRTVDTTLGRLRLKLGPLGERLVALRGLGYKFEDIPD